MQIRIYTKSHCSFCYAAKHLLARRGLEYDEILVLDVTIEQEMQELTGNLSVPQIVIDGTPIGGYAELAVMDRGGGLQATA